MGIFGLMTYEYYKCNVGFFLCTFLPTLCLEEDV